MYPLFSPIDYGLAAGIDGAALEKVFHGFAQLLTVTEVVVQRTLFHLVPVFSPDPYDFHGNHPLSL